MEFTIIVEKPKLKRMTNHPSNFFIQHTKTAHQSINDIIEEFSNKNTNQNIQPIYQIPANT